ncbi:MAG: glycoside hydrolase family 3 C-terminal domain-containing protein [Bacteroidaceae bacterium]|nr:glycoside hydrolase family 3 C-terminal domain-containing protein [Bacteroidaceae bacterium]
MRTTIAVICSIAALAICGCNENVSVLSRDRMTVENRLLANEKKIDRIISGMTLEEKVAMLHGKNMFTTEGVPSQGIADMYYADGPFGIREEMEPKSWNPLNLSNDSATFFPTGSALAATWSEELAYEYGTGMAREARLRGKDMILGPAINIQRIPTGGRTFEYLSEDPYLSSRITVGYVHGVQDNGVAACMKHFALNNQETNRGSVDVIVSPRAMREIYLPAFEAGAVEGNAYGVMSAYNKINGYWCAENKVLLNDILRQDWGFKGMVISDWGGTHSTVPSITAGLNVEMPTQTYFGQALIDSVASGAVSEELINERVREILRVRLLIDPVPEEKMTAEMTAKPEQAAISYNVAAKSVVLLKNNGILPVDASKIHKIAVIGDNADRKMCNGGVGAGVKAKNEITPLHGLMDRVPEGVEIEYAQGYTSQQARMGGFGGGFGFGFGFRRQSPQELEAARKQQEKARQDMIDQAVKAAESADVVFFFGGTNRQWETEGSDRQDIMLPYGQEDVLEAVVKANPNTVFIAVAGGPVDLRKTDSLVPAIIQSWFNGSEGGHALADMLLGTISPSGRLPFSYPYKLEDSPAYALKNFPQTDAPIDADIFVNLVASEDRINNGSRAGRSTALYTEDLLVGYRWFTTKQLPVMYPFGYGLSYADFNYSDLKLSKESYVDGENITATFTVNNTSTFEADDVPQLYVHRTDATIEWPERELKAFKRVSIKGGESVEVTLEIPVEQLKYWNEDAHDWTLEPGQVEIQLCSNSSSVVMSQTCSVK